MNLAKQTLLSVALVAFATTAFAQSKAIPPVFLPSSTANASQTTARHTVGQSLNKLASSPIHSSPISTSASFPSFSPVPQSDVGNQTILQASNTLGRSFFDRIRELNPVKINVTRGANLVDHVDDGQSEYLGGRFARFLPVSVRIRSNHTSKYTAFFGGYVDLEDFDQELTGGLEGLSEFNGGWQLGVKRGRTFANGFRLESEFTFRHNTNDSFSTGNFVGDEFVPAATFDSIDSLFQISTLTNVLYDFHQFSYGGFTPYIGGGLGGTYADGDIATPGLGANDFFDEYVFAYQLIAGVSHNVRQNVTAFAEYKYFGTSGVDVGNAAGFVDEFDLQSNNIIFGLRFNR